MSVIKGIAFLFAVFFMAGVQAESGPVGLWKSIDEETGEPKSLVRIALVNGSLEGKIEKIFDPAKQNVTCQLCEDNRRGKRVVGMTIIENVKQAEGESYWEGGTILDPQKGKTYRVRLAPQEGGRKLQVRGYLGPFFRTQIWVREEGVSSAR
ncbi:MAG: DUF2147 domain-containing protein [Lautropia sp.]|nr:DUF2147 domain-containing protein [Lautropia sp.]